MIYINKLIANSIVITTGGDDPELTTPLYFEENEAGASVAMLCWDDYNWQQTDLKCHLQYSTDKMVTWATYDGSIIELDDCEDSRVYFRADPENPNTDGFHKDDWDNNEVWTHYFKTDGSVKAGGNIQFLLESTGTRTDVPEYGFYNLFGYNSECTSLTTAPSLPATTLDYHCYDSMFQGCTSLTTAPSLPATTLAGYCYENMFYNCTSLTTVPALPATTLAVNCYSNMFRDCTSLTTAPTLPATTLANNCYYSMFQGCTSLTSAPALQAETLADSCYYYMFKGCTSLTTALETLPATTLTNSCYRGMFADCTSLTTAPILPATTLVGNCYRDMFNFCSSLTSIDVSFTAWNPSNATSNWVSGVAASGTFTCPSTLPDTPRDADHIPSGWTKADK